MAAQKCNYIIFSNCNQNISNKIALKMYNQKLTYNPNPTFLGITFEKKLTFQKHVDKLRKKCTNRLNCIKIISNKTWNLTSKTLRSIYASLIRSVIDYSSFILTRLSKKRKKQLQAIQNAAIRAIFKLRYDTPSKKLNKIAQLTSVEERMSDLNEAYALSAILNENPLF
ncbi:RNA-directed DNA polymerase from mobile element jockey-like [Brachionus plicatilis]|uniref:RNA-directed DNA polymerase from mobile element jockey-like n=1 Tax=Brachionus plicatilis TaxID=10195 RepID=A0A3M7PB63_BRAPC|nr:RNA-directed DNA polymerase from mobile element jockey-like [Brachionus plicatilis]